MTISSTTISCSRAIRKRSSTTSTAAASPRPTRPATSRRRPPRTRASRLQGARRSTASSTRPTLAPACCIAAPAVTDPSVAPQGGEALYVLVHTPYLRPHHDWQQMFPAYRQVILDKLKRTAGMGDIEERIVVERHLTPQDIHDRYKVLNGAIYGLASHGKFMGAFKPGNRSRQVRGLYLAGGAAHPGPGMPLGGRAGGVGGA